MTALEALIRIVATFAAAITAANAAGIAALLIHYRHETRNR